VAASMGSSSKQRIEEAVWNLKVGVIFLSHRDDGIIIPILEALLEK